MESEPIDHWFWFNLCVNKMNIQPSEFWNMEVFEVILAVKDPDEKREDIDTSTMLNFERIQNGAPRKWLLKK